MYFCEKQKFREILRKFAKFPFLKIFVFTKISSKHWHQNVKENFRFYKHFLENLVFSRKNMLSEHCHVLAVLSSLSCPGYLTGRLVQSDLFRLSCPRCPVQDALSWPLSRMSSRDFPVETVLSRLSLSRLPCLSGLVPDVLHNSTATVISSRLSYLGCSFLAVMLRPFCLSFPGCTSLRCCRTQE